MVDKESALQIIYTVLEQEPAIDLERFPIQVSFANGDLILEAELENVAAKKLTLELIGSVPGIDRIIDRLRVRPAERVPDARVCEQVCNALLAEPALINCSIRAGSRTVTLEGLVSKEEHRQMAESDAWYVFGVGRVINRLVVRATLS
jgi:osmotically-inducible protein OsmY